MDETNKKKKSGCVVFVSAFALVVMGGWVLVRGLAEVSEPSARIPQLAHRGGR